MGHKIKSTTLYKYDLVLKNANAQELDWKKHKFSYTEFDENQNIVCEIKYNEDGEVDEKNINKFDKKGNLIEELSYLTEDEIAEHKTYERDEKGNVVKIFKHYQDGEKDTINFIRDQAGKILEKITIDSYNEEEAREIIEYAGEKVISRKEYEYDELVVEESYKYNEKGVLIELTRWTHEDEDSKYKNIYDDEGNIYKALKYNLKDKLISKAEYFYKDGKLAEIAEESPYGKNITRFNYDEAGNVVLQTEENGAGKLNNKAIRKFNEHNDVSETEVFIDFHGKGINQHYVLKYEYEYL
ncbi:MAG: hypothetical protein R2750_10235 [Bacteroidales bacterium]